MSKLSELGRMVEEEVRKVVTAGNVEPHRLSFVIYIYICIYNVLLVHALSFNCLCCLGVHTF